MVYCESLSLRGHFPNNEKQTRTAGKKQDPRVARGVWEERERGLQSGRSKSGGPSMGRASPHHLSCWDQLSFLTFATSQSSHSACPCHLLSPGSPWTTPDKLQQRMAIPHSVAGRAKVETNTTAQAQCPECLVI